MKSRKTVKAGILQIDVKMGDVTMNLAAAIEGIKALGDQGADIVVLPEMWSCGFDNKRLLAHAQKTPEIIDKLSQLSFDYHMVIAGSLPEASGKNIFNTLYVVESDGSIAGSYRKIHLFSPTGEDRYFTAGSKAVVCETSICPVGLMICYDLRFPELCRTLTLKGALMVIVPAQWPVARTRHWDIFLQARAMENQLFMVGVNRCGKELELEYEGHSQIISPLGNILVMAGDQPSVQVAELDFSELENFRKSIPSLAGRVPAAYSV